MNDESLPLGHNKCICGRIVLGDGPLARHQAGCDEYLAHLNVITQTFRPLTRKLKRRRVEATSSTTSYGTQTVAGSSQSLNVSWNPGITHDKSNIVAVSVQESDAPVQVDESTDHITSHDLPLALPLLEPPQTPPPTFTDQGRPIRQTRGQLPARFRDFLPEGPPLLETEMDVQEDHSEIVVPPALPTSSPTSLLPITRTRPNSFGIIKEYIGEVPVRDPDAGIPFERLIQTNTVYMPTPNDATLDSEDSLTSTTLLKLDNQVQSQTPYYAPYPNESAYKLDKWYWKQPLKSNSDFRNLMDIITDPTFHLSDVADINWKALRHDLGNSSSINFDNRAAWKPPGSVTISVPSPNGPPLPFTVDNIMYKSLVEVIRERFESPKSKTYHYIPHRLIWKPDHLSDEQLISGELYNSPSFINEHIKLHASPLEPGCNLPRSIAALMLWSDSTHLADFGTTSLWPIYLQFGNESKYTRGQPSQNSFVHIIYLHFPNRFQEFIKLTQARATSSQLKAHLKRELMHEIILKFLLDKDFMEAYEHGIVVECSDGVKRRLYPRFFTYSADYPEKVLLATIRDMGGCPCPRCMVRQKNIHLMATPQDLLLQKESARVDDIERQEKVKAARSLIYEGGYVVNSKAVETLLKPTSMVPTLNAFSERLSSKFGFDYHQMFVPDSLHEWALGVTKQVVLHLVRILYAQSKSSVGDFDDRFNLVPSFGRDTIRSFEHSVSEFTKFAAHNYDDVLICIQPVFEGLLPEPHNTIVLDLLFIMNYTHSLAKLRLHTSATLDLLSTVTAELGKHLRLFKNITCEAYSTSDLPKEAAAKAKRQAKAASQASMPSDLSALKPKTSSALPRAKREFNLNTPKFHSVVGDYVPAIGHFGTMDSYSTQLGEVQHKKSKSERFERTNKKNFEQQLASMDLRESRFEEIDNKRLQDLQDFDHAKEIGESDATSHHFIGVSQKNPIHIGSWLRQHGADPATRDFFPRLKAHILTRLDQQTDQQVYPSEDLMKLDFLNDRMYSHQILRVNFTTYDIRRDQDIIKAVGPHRDIMLLSARQNSTHPFCYARIIGIFHVNVIDKRQSHRTPQRIEFLFVQWFHLLPGWNYGFNHLRMPLVSFLPETDPNAWGFVDPSMVVRAAHLIPRFMSGSTNILLRHSYLSRGQDIVDYKAFFVNWFVDKDMLVRYTGHGIGHINMPRHELIGLSRPKIIEESFNHDTSINQDIGAPTVLSTEEEVQDLPEETDSESEPEEDLDSVDDIDMYGIL
ncbi:hypothetical protein CPC08DRAFT_763641 [Agrocybe pediades]|nr:hypothetical protein CPC08DRAFT_763641 [Agrocybe pediades]